MPSTSSGPDSDHSTSTKDSSVTTLFISPSERPSVSSTNSLMSSAMRWSGLSVFGSVSAMR